MSCGSYPLYLALAGKIFARQAEPHAPEGKAARRGAWTQTSAELAPQVLAALKPGDTVLVKGSLGSKMAVIIDALKARGV